MKSMRVSLFLLATVALTFSLAVCAQAQTVTAAPAHRPSEKILASFTGEASTGVGAIGALISDAAGNLYGVDYHGGLRPGLGSVFEMSPTATGGWTTKSIYRFQFGTDGQLPIGGLVMDPSGNIYGTTQGGGTNLCQDGFDIFSCGTVFELSPNGVGGWSERIIYNFSKKDGFYPTSGLILDSAGNLYGTTAFGGSLQAENEGVGTVFELRRSGNDWTARILHRFGQPGTTDGRIPYAPLISDAAGNLFGETFSGGQSGYGTVFELTHTANGWKEDILFDFGSDSSGASGLAPTGGLIFDNAGNLYGTTGGGGIGTGYGTIFELMPKSGGAWSESVLYNFTPQDNSFAPEAGLVLDAAGNLYGTTPYGGAVYKAGNVFELKRSNDAWTYISIYSFGGYPTDGYNPESNLLIDKQGNLYGITGGGGAGGTGAVFEITP